MFKAVLIVIAFVGGISTANAAQDSDTSQGILSGAFDQILKRQNEERELINAHTAEIKKLREQVASNKATPPAPSAAASASKEIDYTLYDQAYAACGKVRPFVPAEKDANAVWFNTHRDQIERYLASCAGEIKAKNDYVQRIQAKVEAMAPPVGHYPVGEEEAPPQSEQAQYRRDYDSPGYGVRRPMGRPHCAPIGSPEFLRANPKPQGNGWFLVEQVPGKPCGGWAREHVY